MPDGRNGAVDIANLGATLTARITRWNDDERREIFESTGFGNTSAWKDKEAGMVDLVGTAEGFLDVNTPFPNHLIDTTTSAAMILQEATGRTTTFLALVSNITRTVQRTGALNSFAFSFESTGEVFVV